MSIVGVTQNGNTGWSGIKLLRFDIMLSAERTAIPALAENQGGMFTKSGNVFYCLTTVIMDAARLMVTTRANMRFSGQLDENFRFIRQLPHIFYDYPF
jgi:hypothetical protein